MSDQAKYNYIEVNKEGFLKPEDSNILSSFRVPTGFNYTSDKIELYIYSFDSSFLLEDTNYSRFKVVQEGYTLETNVSTIEIDPVEDAKFYNFNEGDVNLSYNFIRKITENNSLFIESISPDRSELLLYSLELTDSELLAVANQLTTEFREAGTLPRIVLRIDGENYLQIVNVGINRIEGRDSIKVKLYEPLPPQFNTKTNTSLAKIVSEPVEYGVTREQVFTEPIQPTLRGPNFNVEVQLLNSNPSALESENDIISGSSGLIYAKVGEQGVELNVDYSDYSSFVHFSSAQERLNNFQYKLSLIKSYEPVANTGSISEVFSGFDHYDRFLYFETGSYSWPKTSGIPDNPTGSAAISFFNSQSLSATYFDETNPHRLVNTIPSFLRDDPNNGPYTLFIDMIGQHFDNLWLYAKGLSDRYDNDNRVDYGISKDLVADALRGFGIKLYGSSINLQNLFSMFEGTGVVTGSEQITTAISASNIDIPLDDYQKELYKRLYHNVPLLLKSKGTERGLRALLNVFGIPKNLLDIRLYGGQNSEVLPFYGPYHTVTGSLEKIRTDNTGSVYGTTLSKNTFITEIENKYTQDIHILEVGFSPSNEINKFLTTPYYNLNGYVFDTDATESTVDLNAGKVSFNNSDTSKVNIVYLNSNGSIDYTSNIDTWLLSSSNRTITFVSESVKSTFEITGSTFVQGSTNYYELHVINGDGGIFVDGGAVDIQIRSYGTSTLLTSSFDIDDYIGDPRLYTSSEYTSLRELAETTFSGSLERYNLYDYIRLLKYYDNVLFKMVEDFTPARSNTATGLIIKPHILERNKVKSVEVSFTQPEYSGSIDLVSTDGTYGFNKTGNGYAPELTASYGQSVQYKEGGSGFIQKLDTLYTGEFGAARSSFGAVTRPSRIILTNGELNQSNIFKRKNLKTYSFRTTLLTEEPEDLNLGIRTVTHISP